MDSTGSANSAEDVVVGAAAAVAMDGLLPRRRLLACESAAKAYSVADISEKSSQEIETVAWKRPHGGHSVSCAVGALQVHRSKST